MGDVEYRASIIIVPAIRLRQVRIWSNDGHGSHTRCTERQRAANVLKHGGSLYNAVVGELFGVVRAHIRFRELLERAGRIEVPQTHADLVMMMVMMMVVVVEWIKNNDNRKT